VGKSPARAKALQPAQVRSYWCRKIPLNNEVFFSSFLFTFPNFSDNCLCTVQAACSVCPHASARAQSFFVAAAKKKKKKVFVDKKRKHYLHL